MSSFSVEQPFSFVPEEKKCEVARASEQETRTKEAIRSLQQQLYVEHLPTVSTTQCNHPSCDFLVDTSPYQYYCALHNKYHTGLENKPSTLGEAAGEGLFVADFKGALGFAADDVLDVYGGEIHVAALPAGGYSEMVTTMQANAPVRSRYLFAHGTDYYVDAQNTKSCMARWANTNPGHANAVYRPLQCGPVSVVVLMALVDLAPGTEIFVDYGTAHPVF